MHTGGHTRARRYWAPLVALLALSLALPAALAQPGAQTFVPVGGGYDNDALPGFAQIVISHASGDVVKILVVPSSYGDAPEDRDANLELAGERTQQLEDACTAVLADSGFASCDAELLTLLDRADAEDPANSAAFNDPETDGAFILGGDQQIAMEVLADTPAETVMSDAYARGVVFGGTSAGAAVQSQTMINGYTDPGYPENALERDKVIVWWPDGEDEMLRGLSFGSTAAIYDQHFYQRGRFGRLLNVVAQSREHFGTSQLGVGVDYQTGVEATNDELLARFYGDTSAAIVDDETLGATLDWVGPNDTLSARNVLTHIIAPGNVTYDMTQREVMVDGDAVALDAPAGWDASLLAAPGPGTLILGGDLSLDWSGAAVDAFAEHVAANPDARKLLIVSAGYADGYAARRATAAYAGGLQSVGLGFPRYQVKALAWDYVPDWENLDINALLDGVAGVVFVGGDQSQLAGALGDARFQGLVQAAVAQAPVVLTDRAMTAAMGDWYVANPEPTDDNYQDMAIADFHSGDARIMPGLGIVHGADFEVRNTIDQRWGRLYALTIAAPSTIAFGISEMTALVLHADGAHVAGERSVIAIDGRAATSMVGDNGAFTDLNVLLDAFAPGDMVMPER
jgi:cyanophycinase